MNLGGGTRKGDMIRSTFPEFVESFSDLAEDGKVLRARSPEKLLPPVLQNTLNRQLRPLTPILFRNFKFCILMARKTMLKGQGAKK